MSILLIFDLEHNQTNIFFELFTLLVVYDTLTKRGE